MTALSNPLPTPDEVMARHRSRAPAPGMVLPDYAAFGTCNVSQLILRNFGLRNRCPECLTPLLDRQYSQVLLVIMDALGWNLIHNWLDELPSLHRLYQRATALPLTTTFPSTTTVALTTLYTGLTPAEHTITGHHIYLREVGAVMDVLRFSPLGDPRREVYAERGVDVHTLFPMYTLFEPLKEAGLRGLSITRGIFTNTALGWLHHVGADVTGYLTGADMHVHLRRALQDRTKDGVTVVYWDVVDMLSHEYTPFSPEVRSAIDQFFYSLEREVQERIPVSERADTLLLITADHGQCAVTPPEAVCLAEDEALRNRLLLPPTGQSRASYLYANQGEVEELGAELQRYEDRLIVRRSKDVLADGLFGAPEHAERICRRVGDYTVIGKDGAMFYGPEISRGQLRVKGHHGSLTENEMLVPLLAVPLANW